MAFKLSLLIVWTFYWYLSLKKTAVEDYTERYPWVYGTLIFNLEQISGTGRKLS